MADLLIRVFILLAIFASVFLISQIVLGSLYRSHLHTAAVNKRLELIKRGTGRAEIAAQLRKNAPSEFLHLPRPIGAALRSFQRALFAAAVPVTFPQALTAMLAMFLLIGALILIVAAMSGFTLTPGVVLLACVLAFSVSWGIPLLVVNILAQKRRKRMEQQFPVALDIFVRALRSGHPIASAIELLTKEMEDPIGSEFGLVSDEVAYGSELTDALDAMAERWDLEDIRMFVVSLSVQLETGGNLAEILENLSSVIRARASLFLKVRALSSEGRMTGWVLTVLPVLTFIGMFLVNPRFYLDVAQDSIFMFGLPTLMFIYFIGVMWIHKLVDIKV